MADAPPFLPENPIPHVGTRKNLMGSEQQYVVDYWLSEEPPNRQRRQQ